MLPEGQQSMEPPTEDPDGVPGTREANDTEHSSDTSETASSDEEDKSRDSETVSTPRNASGERTNQSASGKDSLYRSDEGTLGKADGGRSRSTSRKKTKSGRYTSDITLEEMQGYFHLPAYEAARRMGVGLTILKRLCRKFGVKRWPYQRKRFADMKEEELLEQQRQRQQQELLSKQQPQQPHVHALLEQLISLVNQNNNTPYGQGQFQSTMPAVPQTMAAYSSPSTGTTMGHAFHPPASDPSFLASLMDHAQKNSGSVQTQQSQYTGIGTYLEAIQAHWIRQQGLHDTAFRPYSQVIATQRHHDTGTLMFPSGHFGGTSAEEFRNRNFADHHHKDSQQ